jgi:hypothetical protein
MIGASIRLRGMAWNPPCGYDRVVIGLQAEEGIAPMVSASNALYAQNLLNARRSARRETRS